jgi:LacI family transcriptional regulator
MFTKHDIILVNSFSLMGDKSMKIEDIARLADVSKSAVSLAINGKPGVSAETRERILSIVEEHNYVPLRNVNNRSKKKKATIRFIACKSPDLITEQYQNLPFFNELISYLSSGVNNYPYDLVISTFDEETILEELKEVEQEQPSEGIILLGTNLHKSQVALIHHHYSNLVILDTHHPDIDANFVSINNYLGGYSAADYLIKQGHQKIGYVMGIPRITNFEERKKGFLARLHESNFSIADDYFFQLPAMEIKDAEELRDRIQSLNSYPTAIFCENDYMAISMVKLFNHLNIKVPEEISIIGFDDIRESRVITPELTTLQVNKKEMTAQTLDLLDKQINKSTATKHIQVNTTLIERNSSTNSKKAME